MGMIFVPSVGGISHSPKELTRWPDCANGANVLLHTILAMDEELSFSVSESRRRGPFGLILKEARKTKGAAAARCRLSDGRAAILDRCCDFRM